MRCWPAAGRPSTQRRPKNAVGANVRLSAGIAVDGAFSQTPLARHPVPPAPAGRSRVISWFTFAVGVRQKSAQTVAAPKYGLTSVTRSSDTYAGNTFCGPCAATIVNIHKHRRARLAARHSSPTPRQGTAAPRRPSPQNALPRSFRRPCGAARRRRGAQVSGLRQRTPPGSGGAGRSSGRRRRHLAAAGHAPLHCAQISHASPPSRRPPRAPPANGCTPIGQAPTVPPKCAQPRSGKFHDTTPETRDYIRAKVGHLELQSARNRCRARHRIAATL